ncbi:unnamed protein product [Arabis nemorensis]|uniref:Uncharacterized protein n=1 Tax=Arabis nemorensis TaxID=586526 RepID=A0A565AN19_9BRAS|nr:unnamed protein product [Arabis nemorensis]
MYQRNFRLNVTGELDEITLQHVVIPRCGVPDVVNGTSTMHGGTGGGRRTYEVSFAGRGPRFHAVKHYSFFPGEPRWPDHNRDLTYATRVRSLGRGDSTNVHARGVVLDLRHQHRILLRRSR